MVWAFQAANQRAVDKQTAPENWDHEGKYVKHLGAFDQKELRRGAIQAFKEEHPENIQTALLNLDEFAIHDSYVNRLYSQERDARENIISDLIRDGNDPSAVINLALLPTVAPDEKQGSLDNALLRVVQGVIYGGKAFIDALLEAGANELPVIIERWVAGRCCAR